MATAELAAEHRKKEVSDVSYTSGDVDKSGTDKTTLTYGDQEIGTCQKAGTRKTLSPEDFEITHDEDTTYKDLFISDVNADRFQPPNITGEPAPDIMQTRDEEFQLKPEEWEPCPCTCADGSPSTGRKNVRTGKIDCECNPNKRKQPNVYKPEKNKPRVVDTKPLKAQAGVSYMGNVNLEPCKTFDNETTERANATLNDVVQVGKENSSSTNRQPADERINNKGDVWNIYSKCNHKLYGIDIV